MWRKKEKKREKKEKRGIEDVKGGRKKETGLVKGGMERRGGKRREEEKERNPQAARVFQIFYFCLRWQSHANVTAFSIRCSVFLLYRYVRPPIKFGRHSWLRIGERRRGQPLASIF